MHFQDYCNNIELYNACAQDFYNTLNFFVVMPIFNNIACTRRTKRRHNMGAKLQCTSLDEDVPQPVANKSHARDADKHNETVGDGVLP